MPGFNLLFTQRIRWMVEYEKVSTAKLKTADSLIAGSKVLAFYDFSNVP